VAISSIITLANIESIRVIAMVERRAEDSQDSDFKKLLKVACWEVPIVEMTDSDTIF